MRTIERVTAVDDSLDDAAGHLVAVASALAALPMARAMSSTQFVAPAQRHAILQLAPTLAARHGLRVTIQQDGDALTVTFERNLSAG